MESSTKILRRMLDERGAEWEDCGNGATYVEHNGEAWRFDYDEPFDQLAIVCLSGCTPAQAIAATLGSCNCSDNCTNGERTGTCHIKPWKMERDTGFFDCMECSECGYVTDVSEWAKATYCAGCGRRVEQ